MATPTAWAAATLPWIHGGNTEPLRMQVPNLVHHGWTCGGGGMSLVIDGPTVPYHYGDPDECRVGPHRTLSYDWSRTDG